MAVNKNSQFDAEEVQKKLANLLGRTPLAVKYTNEEIANELLRLSSLEVPHDKGTLQNSGTVQPAEEIPGAYRVGYNTKYAARLHEHPEYRFQRGRKGKYLEDPLKHNVALFGREWGIAFGTKVLK